MYGLLNGTNTNDLEWVWRWLLLLYTSDKRVARFLRNSRASCF